MLTVATYQNNDEIALPLSPDGVKERKLCKFINKYQPRFLKKALGYNVMVLLDAGITSSEQRWLDLMDGVDYTLNGVEEHFEGILPLVARYVYRYYMDHEATTITHTGEKREKSANAEIAIINSKAQRMWSEMHEGMNSLWDFLQYRLDGDGERVYPEFDSSRIHINHFRTTRFGI